MDIDVLKREALKLTPTERARLARKLLESLESLPPEQKQEVFLVLGVTAPGPMQPESRKFSREQMDAWIADDEEGLRRFQADESDPGQL